MSVTGPSPACGQDRGRIERRLSVGWTGARRERAVAAVAEGGRDHDVSTRHGGRRVEGHERSSVEQPPALPRVAVGGLAERRLGRRVPTQEGLEVVGLEQDPEPIGREGPTAERLATLLHRALDASTQLLGFDGGTEEAADRPLHEAFEEPFDRGQGWRHGVERI